ncbi:hypothetical protein LJR125_000123 [Pseudoxanthomonas sp. LjRoot125]|uniref:hypothetical protein n=1 Tax=Pseudoxanthomonas sp. LjRoot125 TaxID=3342258 RepID=UPI003E11F625
MAANDLKPWVVAMLVFCAGLGLTVFSLAWWIPPPWRVVAGIAGVLIASKLAAISAAAWRTRHD